MVWLHLWQAQGAAVLLSEQQCRAWAAEGPRMQMLLEGQMKLHLLPAGAGVQELLQLSNNMGHVQT